MSGARRFFGFAALFAGLLALPSCDGTPSQPDMGPPPGTVDVAGNWSGTWTFSAAGVTVIDNVTMSLTQNGASAQGSWTSEGGAAGNVTFTSMAAVSGSMTINQPLLGGSSCNASTTIAGSASPTQLELTPADLTSQGVCQWGTGNRFVLTR